MRIKGDQIWDPLRQTWVAHTPEEDVRQWFVELLIEKLRIEPWRMASEYSVVVGRRRLRADIVVFEKGTQNVFGVVECKAPGVEIDQKVIDQLLIYAGFLGARVVVATNGIKTIGWDNQEKAPITSLDNIFGH